VTENIPRALMALAIACLGADRGEWGLAMKAEFDVAEEDGRGFSFAASCLAGALRQMPVHEEGRFTLSSYAIAIVIIVPAAVQFMCGALLGSAFLLNDGSRATAPALALLVVLLTVGHLIMAWVMLERDWTRICFIGRVNAAATTTLFMVAGIIFLDETVMMLPVALLMIEVTSVLLLRHWYGQFFNNSRSSNAIGRQERSDLPNV